MEVEVRMSPDRLSKGVRICALALLVSTLVACGTATVVRPGGGSAGGGVSTPKTSVPKPGQTVVVRKGDTIYALARIHDITPADLIAWNRLDNPSTIYPGQVIRLYPQGPPAAVRRPRWSLRRARVAAVLAAPHRRRRQWGRCNIAWRWPADGAIVGRYVAGDATKQGVDIAGTSGQPVKRRQWRGGVFRCRPGRLRRTDHHQAQRPVAVGLWSQPAPGQ